MARICETDRLILAVLDEAYAARILAYYIRNKDFLEPWENVKTKGFYTIENQMRTLKLDYKSYIKGEQLRYWIFLNSDKNLALPIGSVCLSNIIRGAFKSCFLGYKLDFQYEGKGYMTEAVGKIAEVAFEDIKLHRIEANIMPKNLKSIKVALNNGFIEEGRSKQYLKINGVWEDHIHMVKINDSLEL